MINGVIIISGIGIIQSILFFLLVTQKKYKQYSDWVLMSWFLCFAIHLGLIVLIHQSSSQTGIVLAKTFGLLHGPFSLFYTYAIFNNSKPKRAFLHIVPFVIFSISAFLVNKP